MCRATGYKRMEILRQYLGDLERGAAEQTTWVICKGRLTMEEIIFSLKHYWRFVDCEALELKALSQGMGEKTA